MDKSRECPLDKVLDQMAITAQNGLVKSILRILLLQSLRHSMRVILI